jgi:hypothetical protein
MNGEMRIDRVVSRLPEGTEHIVSLILRDVGLYVIHTGDEDDLAGYQPNNTDTSRLENIEKGERMLDQMPLEELVEGSKSAFIDPPSITSVRLETEPLVVGLDVPVLHLETNVNTFRFLFPYTAIEQVQALAGGLKQAVRQ